MRRQNHIVEPAQGRLKRLLVAARFERENINRCAQQFIGLQSFGQGFDFNHRAARGIDQHAAGLHGGDLRCAHHPLGAGQLGHMQADNV